MTQELEALSTRELEEFSKEVGKKIEEATKSGAKTEDFDLEPELIQIKANFIKVHELIEKRKNSTPFYHDWREVQGNPLRHDISFEAAFSDNGSIVRAKTNLKGMPRKETSEMDILLNRDYVLEWIASKVFLKISGGNFLDWETVEPLLKEAYELYLRKEYERTNAKKAIKDRAMISMGFIPGVDDEKLNDYERSNLSIRLTKAGYYKL